MELLLRSWQRKMLPLPPHHGRALGQSWSSVLIALRYQRQNASTRIPNADKMPIMLDLGKNTNILCRAPWDGESQDRVLRLMDVCYVSASSVQFYVPQTRQPNPYSSHLGSFSNIASVCLTAFQLNSCSNSPFHLLIHKSQKAIPSLVVSFPKQNPFQFSSLLQRAWFT
jgi:hypothetical protein